MSSKRRIDASRRNGALSRGPTTEAGKHRSSRNNLRHGMLARTVVLDDEDENVFIEFIATLEQEHQPIDQTEQDLIETMAVARWRVMRLWAIEKANLEHEIKLDRTPGRDYPTRAALAFRKLCDESRSADLLCRYETRYDRQYCRAFNLLLKKRAQPVPPAPICPAAPCPVAPICPAAPICNDPCPSVADNPSSSSPPPPSDPLNANLPFEPNPENEQPQSSLCHHSDCSHGARRDQYSSPHRQHAHA